MTYVVLYGQRFSFLEEKKIESKQKYCGEKPYYFKRKHQLKKNQQANKTR